MKFLYSFFLIALTVSPVSAQNGNNDAGTRPETIIVKEGQNIRDLAKTYLDDPNLWTEILRTNNLKSPADVKPNMTLKLPDPIINKAADELKKAQQAIDEASKAGAKVFAPGMIAMAIQLQNDALAKRKARDWDACYQLAREALNKAEEAVRKSPDRTEAAGQAVLADRKGTVQSRKPSDQLWNDLSVKAILVEGEKVRTLSESYAEIQFKDNKRVRLNENSQIVISKMEAKILKDKEESSVSLMKGDAYMLLDNKPRAEGRGERAEGSDPAGTHPLATASRQLSSPNLISPANSTALLFRPGQNQIELKWEKVPDASSYWLEIAADRGFKRMALNQKNLEQPSFNYQSKDGVFYWRVAAVDASGFPGTNSRVRFFKITTDTEPPYLVIHSPRTDEILPASPARIRGETEGDAVLSFDGKTVSVSGKGVYAFDIPLTKGVNQILLKATDKAGNVTEMSRSFFFDPNVDVEIHYDTTLLRIAPKHFITRHSAFTLIGRTEPNTAVSVRPAEAAPRSGKSKKRGRRRKAAPAAKQETVTILPKCFADDKGRFHLNLPIEKAKTEFILSVTSLGGHVTRDTFIVEADKRPPEIRLSNDPPLVSAVEELLLSGNISEKSSVSLNGSEIEYAKKQFDETVELKPGTNSIQLIAQDYAGNISFLDRKIILDRHPPKFLSYKLSQKVASGGESFFVSVLAEDESGLKEAAEFKIQAGEYVHTGFLKLNNATRTYHGTVNLPEQAKGKIRLSYVKLSDYNDNHKEYDIK